MCIDDLLVPPSLVYVRPGIIAGWFLSGLDCGGQTPALGTYSATVTHFNV